MRLPSKTYNKKGKLMLEFVTDLKRYHVLMTYEEMNQLSTKIATEFDLGNRIYWYDSPQNGIFHIESVEEDYLKTILAPKLVNAGYLLFKINTEYDKWRLFFGVPAPADMWDRGTVFRVETLDTSRNDLRFEAQKCEFERRVSGLLDQGWMVESVVDSPGGEENYARLMVTLYRSPMKEMMESIVAKSFR